MYVQFQVAPASRRQTPAGHPRHRRQLTLPEGTPALPLKLLSDLIQHVGPVLLSHEAAGIEQVSWRAQQVPSMRPTRGYEYPGRFVIFSFSFRSRIASQGDEAQRRTRTVDRVRPNGIKS